MEVFGNTSTLRLLRHDKFGRKRPKLAVESRELGLLLDRLLCQQLRQLAVHLAQSARQFAAFGNVAYRQQHQSGVTRRRGESTFRT